MADYREYVVALEAAAAAGDCSSRGIGELVDMLDTVMLSLRTADGLDLDAMERRFGAAASDAVWAALLPYAARGLVAAFSSSSSARPLGARLTDPRGFLLSNDMISSVFAAIDRSIANVIETVNTNL